MAGCHIVVEVDELCKVAGSLEVYPVESHTNLTYNLQKSKIKQTSNIPFEVVEEVSQVTEMNSSHQKTVSDIQLHKTTKSLKYNRLTSAD